MSALTSALSSAMGRALTSAMPIAARDAASSVFNPIQLFANAEPGFWYDPSDMSSMWQDFQGVTPVTAVEQPVGLILDKRLGGIRGAEINNSTNFNTPSQWQFSQPTAGSVSIAGGLCRINSADGSYAAVSRSGGGSGILAGKTYECIVTITAAAANGIRVEAGGAQAAVTWSAPGTYRALVTATGTGLAAVKRGDAGVACDVTISFFSVKEVPGNHAVQSTATARPVLSARKNWILDSDMSTAVVGVLGAAGVLPTNWSWSSVAGLTREVVGKGTLPDGRKYIDVRLSGTNTSGATGFCDLYFTNSVSAPAAALNSQGTASFDIQYIAGSVVNGFFNVNRNVFVSEHQTGGTFNGSTGTPTAAGGSFSASRTFTTASTTNMRMGLDLSVATGGTVDLTMRITRPQLEFGLVATAYQRVTTAANYDYVGFPHYLKFDGVDDSLSVGPHVPAVADKLTLFAGVMKLSDAASGCVCEHSAVYTSNNGSFALFAPQTALPNYQFNSHGTADGSALSGNTYPAPNKAVITGRGDIAGDSATIRVDGVLKATGATDQGTGNFLSYVSYIGRRANASLPYTGNIYQLILLGRTATAQELTNTENFIASKSN